MDNKDGIQRQVTTNQTTENVTLTFQNLSYSVMIPGGFKERNGTTIRARPILENISGVCNPGEVTAILGASGAGKTSLLNILAKRIAPLQKGVVLTGGLMANGLPYTGDTFPKFAAYVMQNDILFGTLTPREALQFVANLKYSDPIVKAERVEEAIKMLKLERCQNVMIGDSFVSGISGGERKRTSIGVEMINDPYCILLDEPTSGLDSFTAFIIINLLRKLAQDKKRTIVFTIHQPSSDIFMLFDQIMLLVQGQFIYQGSREGLVPYFKEGGFPCPQQSNPLDYLMGLMQGQNDYQQFFDRYQSTFGEIIQQRIVGVECHEIMKKIAQTTFGYQVSIICGRAVLNLKRNKLMVKGRLGMTLFMGLFMGGVYFGVGREEHSYQSMQSLTGVMFFLVMSNFMGALNPVMVQFPAERDVFLREENSKLYSTTAYFIGKSSVEMPLLVVFPIIQQMIAYWMIGLNDMTADIVVLNVFICILLGLTGNSCGLMAGSMFQDVRTAAGMIPMVIMPLVLFSGFYANQSQFMVWIGWLQYLSPMKYSFEAFVRNEFTGRTFEDTVADPDPIKYYDFQLELWDCIGVLIGFIVIFRILALLFLILLKSKQQ